MKILFFGDSNTYGYDPRGAFGGRYLREIRWTDRLQEAMRGEAEIIAEGMNGRSIPQSRGELRWLVGRLRETEADLLAVMLGTNDCLQMRTPSAEAAAERLRVMVRLLREEEPAVFREAALCRLLILAPPTVEFGGAIFGERPWIPPVRLTDAYRAVAEEAGALFIDTAAWELPMSFDRVHLSEEGHRLMAERLQTALTECLRD